MCVLASQASFSTLRFSRGPRFGPQVGRSELEQLPGRLLQPGPLRPRLFAPLVLLCVLQERPRHALGGRVAAPVVPERGAGLCAVAVVRRVEAQHSEEGVHALARPRLVRLRALGAVEAEVRLVQRPEHLLSDVREHGFESVAVAAPEGGAHDAQGRLQAPVHQIHGLGLRQSIAALLNLLGRSVSEPRQPHQRIANTVSTTTAAVGRSNPPICCLRCQPGRQAKRSRDQLSHGGNQAAPEARELEVGLLVARRQLGRGHARGQRTQQEAAASAASAAAAALRKRSCGGHRGGDPTDGDLA
mmetsp:Transcript_17275/g.35203  ORF Transcript_17275/g.35203 Transcript_17275/m.35203 type:complete len:301 (-) Transcript_17275:962-1864(-)